MYKISFRDKTVKLVTTEVGERVKQLQSTPNTKYVELDQNQYLLSTIIKVEYIPEESTTAKLPQGPRCKAEKSIHREIYYLYKKTLSEGSKRPWKEFLDKAYPYLYTKKDKWCDYKKGVCYCESRQAVEKVIEVFPGAKIV